MKNFSFGFFRIFINRITLVIALVSALDLYLTFYFDFMMEPLLFISILFFTSGAGFHLLIMRLLQNIDNLKKEFSIGHFSERSYFTLLGCLPIFLLFLLPGLLTTTIGFICLLPSIKQLLGKFLSKISKISWEKVHENFYL